MTTTKDERIGNHAARRATRTPDNAPNGYLLKKEVAFRLRKKPRTIERWMRLGIIPFIKIGKGKRATVLFSWPDIEDRLLSRFGVGIN